MKRKNEQNKAKGKVKVRVEMYKRVKIERKQK